MYKVCFLTDSGIPAHETLLVVGTSNAVIEGRPKFRELYDA